MKNMEIANMKQQEMLGNVISEIRSVLVKSRSKVAAEVNKELLATYWKIGEIIAKYEVVVFAISNLPVTDWQIDMDPLL